MLREKSTAKTGGDLHPGELDRRERADRDVAHVERDPREHRRLHRPDVHRLSETRRQLLLELRRHDVRPEDHARGHACGDHEQHEHRESGKQLPGPGHPPIIAPAGGRPVE
jgi:hypothetical protein